MEHLPFRWAWRAMRGGQHGSYRKKSRGTRSLGVATCGAGARDVAVQLFKRILPTGD